MKFGQKVRRLVKVNQLRFKKYSPEIFVTLGAAGTVGAIVTACVATSKLPKVLDECKDRKEELKNMKEEADNDEKIEYSDSDYKRDQTKLAVKNAWEVSKLYLPAAGLEVASLALIFTSNGIYRKRTASLAAAYATLDAMFKRYRNNVVETFGEDIDYDMRYGVKHEKIEVVEVDDKGKEHKHKVKTDVIDTNDPNMISDYAKFYDSSCKGWDKNADYNLMTLKANQAYANNILRAQGYLFLNDVYKIIGIPQTLAGQSVGWIYDPDNNSENDNYVDFGIYSTNRANRRFVNGLEPVILLDFNVDGDLLNNPKLNKMLRKLISK